MCFYVGILNKELCKLPRKSFIKLCGNSVITDMVSHIPFLLLMPGKSKTLIPEKLWFSHKSTVPVHHSDKLAFIRQPKQSH